MKKEDIEVCVCVCMCGHICSVTSSVTCQFFVHGIHQARILAWVAISFSRGIFPTQGWNLNLLHLLHWQANSLALPHLGSPHVGVESRNYKGA